MKRWKNWLFPLLTCLVAVGLALLPLELSTREDGRLAGVIHSEALREDSNFPARVPALPGRVRLLAQWESIPDALTFMDQELEGAALEDAAAQAKKELLELAGAGLLPLEAVEALDSYGGLRLYLRNRSDLTSASFLQLNAWQEDGPLFWLVLDGETGRILSLQMFEWPMAKFPTGASECGRNFLTRLNLSFEEMDNVKKTGTLAVFRLQESQALYLVCYQDAGLSICPEVDWEQLDDAAQQDDPSGMARAALGYDA